MEREAKKKGALDFAIVAKYIIFLLGIHFFFFGYICNTYDKLPGDNLLFVYLSMFDFAQRWYIPWIALVLCVILMAFTEDFLMVAVKKAIWAVPFIVVSSLFWFWWNYYFFITAENDYFDFNPDVDGVQRMGFWEPLLNYFGSYKGYLNILILFIITSGSAILGGFLKIKYRERFNKRSAEEL